MTELLMNCLLHLLAQVAETKSGSNVTNPKDCSALKILSEDCHQVVPSCNKECQVNFCEKDVLNCLQSEN